MPKDGGLTIEPVRYTSTPLPPEQYPKGFALGPHIRAHHPELDDHIPHSTYLKINVMNGEKQ